MDMLDTPELVQAWAQALNRMYVEIYEHFYQLLGCQESLCFFGPMAEGRSEGVQCDFAVMLSPEMYEQFVFPDLLAVTNYFDHSLYHLDGTCQLRFLDHLRAMPKLRGIQWNPETTAGPLLGWINALAEIRRRNFSLMIWTSVADAIELTRQLGPDGLFLCLPAFESVEEADEAIAAIARVC